MKKWYLMVLISIISFSAIAQKLQPGFKKTEYIQMLQLALRQVDELDMAMNASSPQGYRLIYRSGIVGLDNRWDLWMNTDSIAVISIRGTSREMVSWLANFYAAMVPAKGSLQLEKKYNFEYHLADDPKAAVHIGWLIGTGMLSRDILPKIDSLFLQGITQFIITGHSQGGGITFLLNSHLQSLQKSGRLSDKIRFKTYSSAAPKPGNLYYAYEYEAQNEEGWAYNVVNSADWVPETPVTIQTVYDFNGVNPFANASASIQKQPFPQRIIMRKIYRKLSNPPRKALRNYQKYLGRKISVLVRKHLPEFEPPVYFNSSNYSRAGNTIVMIPDSNYKNLFPDNKDQIFIHHLFDPYFYLAGKLPNR
jgi:hypothetical protein